MNDTYHHARHARIDWWLKNYERAITNWTLVYFILGIVFGVGWTFSVDIMYATGDPRALFIGLVTLIPLIAVLWISKWWWGYYKIPDDLERNETEDTRSPHA